MHVVEEWKWSVPVRSHDGMKDPKKLFNGSLEGKVRRAIDIKEGEKPDVAANK